MIEDFSAIPLYLAVDTRMVSYFHSDLVDVDWVDVGWVDVGWVDLGWVDLGWVDLGWVDLGWVDLGWADLGCFWAFPYFLRRDYAPF